MVSLFLVATLIGQPILITFYVSRLREMEHVVISCIQGFVFGIDIILNFKTGYTNSRCDTITLDPNDVFWYIKHSNCQLGLKTFQWERNLLKIMLILSFTFM